MARAMRTAKSGPGYAGLIVFIVLCVALIAGYAWLVPQYSARGTVLREEQKNIKEYLEDPLIAMGARDVPRARQVTSAAEAPYEAHFFQSVGALALKGVQFNDLVAKTGYPGENPIDEITQALNRANPPQPDGSQGQPAQTPVSGRRQNGERREDRKIEAGLDQIAAQPVAHRPYHQTGHC